MKKLFIIVTLFIFPFISYSQSENLPDPEPYFSASIVTNIDSSIVWYSRNFGFEILSNKEFPEMGFKQANLKRGNILIELIELKSAISPNDVVSDFSKKTRMLGLFKFGILVSDFDNWVEHLSRQGVNFHGRVVSDEIFGKKMVIVKDPDGNRIQLFEK